MERLKRRDEILFSSSITLFEDELADHGIAQVCNIIQMQNVPIFDRKVG